MPVVYTGIPQQGHSNQSGLPFSNGRQAGMTAPDDCYLEIKYMHIITIE